MIAIAPILFITLIIATTIPLIALYVFICLYVYNDALVNSDKPVVWLLITIFTPNLLGFLIYMLAGRNKPAKPVRKFKIPAIISAIVLAVMMGILMISIFFSTSLPVIDNVSFGMVENRIGSQWEVSFKSSGERLERTIALTDEELENLTIEASCDEGNIYLLLLQGENSEVINISDFPKGKPQLEGFTAGNIRLSLYNEGATNAKIKIDW